MCGCVWVDWEQAPLSQCFPWRNVNQLSKQTHGILFVSCSSLLSCVHLKCEFLFVDWKIPFEPQARPLYGLLTRLCRNSMSFSIAFIYLLMFTLMQSVWLIGCVWCMTDSDTLNIICISDYRQTEFTAAGTCELIHSQLDNTYTYTQTQSRRHNIDFLTVWNVSHNGRMRWDEISLFHFPIVFSLIKVIRASIFGSCPSHEK